MIVKPEHIRSVRPISENVNDVKRLIPYIEECEMLILIPALGAETYKQMNENYLQTNDGIPIVDNDGFVIYIDQFNEFLNGCYYDDDKRYNPGLYKAMGYLVYSRFVRNNNVSATAFGMVQKQSAFSEPLDEKTIIRIANDAEKIGMEYLRQAIDYLKKDSCGKKTKNYSHIKIIGK